MTMKKILLFVLIFIYQYSNAQIASYSFNGNLNDDIANQNGLFTPTNCCDYLHSL
jgi:hypothetical protein